MTPYFWVLVNERKKADNPTVQTRCGNRGVCYHHSISSVNSNTNVVNGQNNQRRIHTILLACVCIRAIPENAEAPQKAD